MHSLSFFGWLLALVISMALAQLVSPFFLALFVAMLYPLLRDLYRNWRMAHAAARMLPSGLGRRSVMTGSGLILTLDHDRGQWQAQLQSGPFKNWMLHEMDGEDLRQLRRSWSEQPANHVDLALLDAWLDHAGPVHWRRDWQIAATGTPPTPAIPTLDRAAAGTILGVGTDATDDMIAVAAQRLRQLTGLSPYLQQLADTAARSLRSC